MNDINSCYCTNYSICTICARGYSSEGMSVYDRDLAYDWSMTRMADAEMGDLQYPIMPLDKLKGLRPQKLRGRACR